MSKKRSGQTVCYWSVFALIMAAFLCTVFLRAKVWSVERIQAVSYTHLGFPLGGNIAVLYNDHSDIAPLRPLPVIIQNVLSDGTVSLGFGGGHGRKDQSVS